MAKIEKIVRLNDTTGLRSQIVTSNKRGGNRYQIQAIRDEMEEILHDQNDINEMTSAQLDASRPTFRADRLYIKRYIPG